MIVIVIACSGLVLNNKKIQGMIINHSQNKIENNLSLKQISKAKQEPANYQPQNTTDADTKTVIDNAIKAKHIQPLGKMSIPAINMKNLILNGYGNDGAYMALGACTMKDETMGQGNYALAGHYMASNTIFHSLSKTPINAKVYITNLKKIYEYQVTSNQTINKLDTSVLDDTPQPTITLITCVGLNITPYRTCVKGKLISVKPATQANLKKVALK